MALLAFTFGDYLATVVPLGDYGATLASRPPRSSRWRPSISPGLKFGIGTQVWLLWLVHRRHGWPSSLPACGSPRRARRRAPRPPAAGEPPPPFALGSALVFVFLAYGGWSDTATLSAEMRDARHGIKRALVLGMSLVTVLYVLVNWAYLRGLSHRRARAQRSAGGRSAAVRVRHAGADADRRDRRADVDHVDERDPDRRRAHDVRGGARHGRARASSAAGTSRAARRARRSSRRPASRSRSSGSARTRAAASRRWSTTCRPSIGCS